MSEFMVQSVTVYGVNLLAMPEMQCVVYALEYKTVPWSLLQPVFAYAYHHAKNKTLYRGPSN